MCISKRNIKWRVSERVTCLMGNTFHFWMEFVFQILFKACHLSYPNRISPCASPIIIRYRSIQCRSLSQSQWIRFFVSVCVAWFHDVGRISLCLNTAIWFYGLAAHCNNILMKGCRCAWNTFLFVLRVCFFCSCGSRRNKKQLAKIMSAQRYNESTANVRERKRE